jgi:hypothetical protein
MMSIKSTVQGLIAENKVKDALQVFTSWAVQRGNRDLENSLLLVQSRFSRLKQQEMLGLIQFSESLREQAIISNSILELLTQVSEEAERPDTGAGAPAPEEAGKVILFLASNPSETSKLQLEKEFVRIFNGIQEGTRDLKLVSEWAVTPGGLQQAILKHRPAIIHFSGHGVGEAGSQAGQRDVALEEPGSGGILLQDANGRPKLVSGAALADLFETMLAHQGINLEVVILNACHQEEQARAISRHVPYVIGTSAAIDDNVAIEFSTGFYRGISARDSSVDFAFRLARNNIMLEGLEDSMVPVLYAKA